MMACTSPAGTSRVRPLRISLSPTVAWRFWTEAFSGSRSAEESGHDEQASSTARVYGPALLAECGDASAALVDCTRADMPQSPAISMAIDRDRDGDVRPARARPGTHVGDSASCRSLAMARSSSCCCASASSRARAAPRPRSFERPSGRDWASGLRRHPTLPSSEIATSFWASTANSIGSSCSTSLTKPLTSSARPPPGRGRAA